MGYTTDFKGSFKFNEPIKKEHADFLRKFNRTRRMKRNASVANTLPDEIRVLAGLPIGDDGAYFVGANGHAGQDNDVSVIDHNTPPGQMEYGAIENFSNRWDSNKKLIESGKCQPGLWCQWTVSEDSSELVWDEGEKFYNYIEWLNYLIVHFIEPWGYKLNGKVKWVGEDRGDKGKIVVTDNSVEVISKNGPAN